MFFINVKNLLQFINVKKMVNLETAV